MKPHKISKLMMALLTVAALFATTLGTAVAASVPQAGEGQRGLFGEVVAVTATGLVVKTKNGEVTVSVTAETLYRAPENDEATLTDLSPGDRIAALVDSSSDPVAITVMFVPTKGKVVHITGVVAEVGDGTLVIVTEDGRRVTAEVGLSGNLPEVGIVVTIVGRVDLDTDVVRVRSMQRLTQTLNRLRNHVDEIQDTSLERDDQLKNVARTKKLLESVSERQLKIVNMVLDDLPEDARGALDRAVRNLEEANQAVQEALSRALVISGQRKQEESEIERKRIHKLPKEARPTLDDLAAAVDLDRDGLLDLLTQAGDLDDVLEDLGISEDEFESRVVTIMLERLQLLVQDGRLTQEAFDLIAEDIEELAEKLIEEVFDEDEFHSDIPFSLADVANVIGIEPSRLVSLLHEGNSVAHIAERAGISTDTLIEKLEALARERLQELVSDGLVASDELDEVLEEMVERIRKEIGKATPLIQKRSGRQDDGEHNDGEHVATPDRVPFDLRLVARILGISEEALINRLQQGGTLDQIAQENGIEMADLVDKLTSAMRTKLAALVESGEIDPDKARKLLEEARERLIKSLREFRHAVLTEEHDEDVRPPSSRLYKDLPITVNDLARALDVSTDELQKWLRQEHGVLPLLEERGIDREDLVAKLLDVAENRLAELVSQGQVRREDVANLLAELKRRLVADLGLARATRLADTEPEREDRPVSYLPFDIETVGEVLGLSTHDLREALASGHTIGEIAERSGVTLDRLIQALMAPLEREIREAVANGRIDQAAATEKLEGARQSFRRALLGFRMVVRDNDTPPTPRPVPTAEPDIDFEAEVSLRTVARVLGLSTDEFRQFIAQGRTVAEVANGQGLQLGDVVQKLIATFQGRLQEAVRNGRISDADAKERLEHARKKVREALEHLVEENRDSSGSERSGPSDSSGTTGSDSPEKEPGDDVKTGSRELRPVAVAGDDLKGVVGEAFVLDGSRSQDDGVIRTFTWRQIDGPRVSLEDTSSPAATVVPSTPGTYVFELVVTDDAELTSEPVKVVVVVEEAEEKPTVDETPEPTGTSLTSGSTR